MATLERPVRPYFDMKGTIDALFQFIHECFAELGVEICEEDTSIFSASGVCSSMPSGYKESFHMILGTKQVFRTMREHCANIAHSL